MPRGCVFAPSPTLTVTVESGADGDDEIHLHAGGQGLWVARMMRTLGVEVRLCCALAGESGRVLRTLVEGEGIEVDEVGLAVLAAAACRIGLDVVVAAPSWDASGASASLTAVETDGRLAVERRQLVETPDVEAYAVEAAPADVNVPNVPLDELRGIARARLASRGAVRASVTERGAGWVQFEYGPIGADHEPGTDVVLLADKHACFTPLSVACEATDVDTEALSRVS